MYSTRRPGPWTAGWTTGHGQFNYLPLQLDSSRSSRIAVPPPAAPLPESERVCLVQGWRCMDLNSIQQSLEKPKFRPDDKQFEQFSEPL